MGIDNAREFIAITTWYLWQERCKLVHEENDQDVNQTTMGTMGIHTLVANYIIALSLDATMHKGVVLDNLWALLNLILMYLLIKTCLGARLVQF